MPLASYFDRHRFVYIIARPSDGILACYYYYSLLSERESIPTRGYALFAFSAPIAVWWPDFAFLWLLHLHFRLLGCLGVVAQDLLIKIFRCFLLIGELSLNFCNLSSGQVELSVQAAEVSFLLRVDGIGTEADAVDLGGNVEQDVLLVVEFNIEGSDLPKGVSNGHGEAPGD